MLIIPRPIVQRSFRFLFFRSYLCKQLTFFLYAQPYKVIAEMCPFLAHFWVKEGRGVTMLINIDTSLEELYYVAKPLFEYCNDCV